MDTTNFDFLFGKIIESSARGRVKSQARQRIIQSMLRHERDMPITCIGGHCIFTKESINKFLELKFRERFVKKKEFIREYWLNVLSVIAKKNNVMNFNRGEISRMITQIKKILYSESKDLSYVVNDTQVVFSDELRDLRTQYGEIAKRNRNKLVYNHTTISRIAHHFSDVLLTYLGSGGDDHYNEDAELALFVLFLIIAPKRKGQLLSLDLEKIQQLIQFQQTEITSKSKTQREFLTVPTQFSKLLDLYVKRTARTEGPLFLITYNKLYRKMISTVKRLFPSYNGVTRVFHGFRNYYADTHKNDGNLSQFSLGHSNNAMTNRYINVQQNFRRDEIVQNSMEQAFHNKLPEVDAFLSRE